MKAIFGIERNKVLCTYEDYNVMTGTLTLTKFDSQKSILSGVFQFRTYNPACGDTIIIADGRFDIAEITW